MMNTLFAYRMTKLLLFRSRDPTWSEVIPPEAAATNQPKHIKGSLTSFHINVRTLRGSGARSASTARVLIASRVEDESDWRTLMSLICEEQTFPRLPEARGARSQHLSRQREERTTRSSTTASSRMRVMTINTRASGVCG